MGDSESRVQRPVGSKVSSCFSYSYDLIIINIHTITSHLSALKNTQEYLIIEINVINDIIWYNFLQIGGVACMVCAPLVAVETISTLCYEKGWNFQAEEFVI